MSSNMNASPATTMPQPLIPQQYLDVPSQRLYYLSLGLLCQAIKVVDLLHYLFISRDYNTVSTYCRKWLVVDCTYLIVLSQLRIPRLNYSKAVVVLQILSVCFLDGLLFGGINVNIANDSGRGILPSLGFLDRRQLPSTPTSFRFSDLLSTLSLGMLSTRSEYDSHLLGQHTVRMSPISTARLNPDGHTFCLNGPDSSVLVPILLNNTSPFSAHYTLAPLGAVHEVSGKLSTYNLTSKDLHAIQQRLDDDRRLTRPILPKQDGYDQEDYDEYDEEEETDHLPSSTLQKTESVIHIQVNQPGVLHLDRLVDHSKMDARIIYPVEVVVAPCPRAEFVEDTLVTLGDGMRCAGEDKDVNFEISMYGVPPLSLRWYKEVNGRREHLMVEGIEGGHEEHPSRSYNNKKQQRQNGAPQELKVPLAASLDALGRHSYVLEAVTDGVGNVIQTTPVSLVTTHGRRVSGHGGNITDLNPNTKYVRSLTVLRRPTVSFRNCEPGRPASLLIGSESSLHVHVRDADVLDSPWDVTFRYQPSVQLDGTDKNSKRYKPWTRALQTQKERRELSLRANAPGEYLITGIKGKYCEGDILSPETCKVVELPLPSADIEWRRIHECSGDTGVSASLVLHGTPPFQVYYRMQRDSEPPRELVNTFHSSRGEVTLQPDRSGHYVFTFLQLSDANYKKVELKGPSIDQVVHPLASADFVHAGPAGRGKRIINSCSGSFVDVDVELKGTGPWNLGVQIVSPTGSENVNFSDITESVKSLHLPIPKTIDKEGGIFEIDLLSVEDSYKCKRTLSNPGMSVNVRRVKPIARFYGKDGKRNVTVLENERASLPLRLTGEGPWHIKYRRAEEPQRIHSAVLTNPNDQLHVTDKGLFEIIEVMDAQCPGSVVAAESTYRVDWIRRPSAKLASETEATYESYNGSHILPPVCEGIDDHVDLDLTGRPPFQIMYNVARNDDTGGIKLLDQPTFNSIQHRTRFQLRTSTAGRMYYEVKQIGDAAYPLQKHSNALIPRSERLLFEQEVMLRPSAYFKTTNRVPYCLHDPFVPRDSLTADGLILLHGAPPFQIQISIKNLAASEVHMETIKLMERSWKIELPSYTFKSIGPHLITIESVQDASHCEQAYLETSLRSIWVDVAETAAIIPFDRREYFCVGETSRFTLEGTAPWSIGYRVNGKSYTQETKTSPFSLIQQQSGEFAITSVAHQHKMCKTAVTDLRYMVHPLPSAQVGHGKRIFQDIHEGDQAEIIFTLVGEPPFTFTYQRAEPSPRKGSRPGKVLETHTVSGVTTKEYSVFSALEGTWTVTFISDRYCRYPAAQVEGSVEKGGR